MTSILTRGLHKILVHRLAGAVQIDPVHRGFKPENGVAANEGPRLDSEGDQSPLYVAFIDFRKAFNSIYHGAILEAAGAAGLE